MATTPLVTDAEVKAVIPTDIDTTPFIATAHLFIDENLASAELSADRLKQVELYLAAHFVAITVEKGSLIRKRVGEASETYGGFVQGLLGRGLQSTRYGQTAINMDTSGVLASMSSSNPPAEFRVV